MPEKPITGNWDSEEATNQITRALMRAQYSALLKHQRDGVPVVICRDGKVLTVPAEELLATYPPIDDEPNTSPEP